ncbi:MAG: hypothetical protein II563_10115 [Treponema sp.]|nr:hypothetical protein [Treponema sp.]
MKKIIVAFGMVLATAFACFAASPASDFEYHRMSESELTDLSRYVNGLDAKGSFIAVDEYKGGDSTVEIPAEIEGCMVIKVTIRGSSKKYVVPASVIWVCTIGRYSDEPLPDIEFLRPKDAAFFWKTIRLPTEKLRDRKIVFPGTQWLYLPHVETFTWSKNWSTCAYYNDGIKYNKSSNTYLFGYDVEELIIEEGIQELPFTINDACEKLVLPKSLKIIYPNTIIVDDNLKDIVIPAGSKIKIRANAIVDAYLLSRTTRKTLDALGYDW